jgi:hypothetical protein|tara:strand:+ start:765 stop:1793 length:1029 start_codon:yes stop_codon:yes gene_type:complete
MSNPTYEFRPSNCTQGAYHRHTICSYEQAKNRWESVKPIRGRVEDVRPVGNRRATEYRIVKETDPDFEEVDVFKIIYYGLSSSSYNTDYVTYYHDGRITLDVGEHASIGTSEVIDAFSPYTCAKRNGYVWVEVGGKYYPLISNAPLTFIGNECLNNVEIVQEVVDRKKTNSIREQIKPFLDKLRIIDKVSNGYISPKFIEKGNAIVEDYDKNYGKGHWHQSSYSLTETINRFFPSTHPTWSYQELKKHIPEHPVYEFDRLKKMCCDESLFTSIVTLIYNKVMAKKDYGYHLSEKPTFKEVDETLIAMLMDRSCYTVKIHKPSEKVMTKVLDVRLKTEESEDV